MREGGEEWVGGEGDTGWSLPSSLFSTISWCRNVLDIQEHSPLEEGQFGFILEVAGNHGVFWKWRERAEYIRHPQGEVRRFAFDQSPH